MMGDPTETPVEATSASVRRQRLLAFVAFLLLFGQPVLVFALAVRSPTPASLAVIVAGTGLLAAPMARAFVRNGGSVSRLANFVLVVAGVQVVLTLFGRAASTTLAGGGLATPVRPAIVLVSYGIAYVLVYRRRTINP